MTFDFPVSIIMALYLSRYMVIMEITCSNIIAFIYFLLDISSFWSPSWFNSFGIAQSSINLRINLVLHVEKQYDLKFYLC